MENFKKSCAIKEVDLEEDQSIGSHRSIDIDDEIAAPKHNRGGSMDFSFSAGSEFLVNSNKDIGANQKNHQGSGTSGSSGGTRRRIGDRHRRMRQRLGFAESIRKSATGDFDMSLQSFTSLNSFSCSVSTGLNRDIDVGNLTFVTDEEMETIVCTDDTADAKPPSATLGTGAFSTVRLAWRASQNSNSKNSEKRELVAVKVMQKSILKQMKTLEKDDNNRLKVLTAFDNIEQEIATMKRVEHPNIVRLFEVIDSIESDRLLMVLEYVSLGEILSHVEGTNKYRRMRNLNIVRGLTENGHYDEKHAALYFVDLMHGLAYLHRHRICHRDLKPENILLCANGVAKIGDFGVAHTFEDENIRKSMVNLLRKCSMDDLMSGCHDNNDCAQVENKQNNPMHLSKCEGAQALNMSGNFDKGILKKTEGTWYFWSPEMCSTDPNAFSGYASDLWAAGVCLYIFTTGMVPFFSLVPTELFGLIATANVQYDGLGLSNELKNLLRQMLSKDPLSRLGVGDCLKHGFCADARKERMGELSTKRDLDEHIILSQRDLDMALSVTVPKNQDAFFNKVSQLVTGSVTACADTFSTCADSVATSTAAGIAGLGAATPIDLSKLKTSAEGLTDSVATRAKRASFATFVAAERVGLSAAKQIDISRLKASAEGLTDSVATHAKRASVAPFAAAELAGLGVKTSVNVAKRATVTPFAAAELAGLGVKTSVNVLTDSVASCADALKASVDVKEKPTNVRNNPKKFPWY